MSRIGKQPVELANNVEFSIGADNTVTVKGDKGSGTIRIHPDITVEQSDNEIIVKRPSDSKNHK
jgi:large subunit ribosomal protein L6